MINDILNTDFQELCIVSQRALFSLISLFLITKLIGKKQVSELNLFDYVISISIGNFAAEMTINTDVQVSNGFIAVIIFGIVALTVSVLTMKSIILRRFFMGTPTIIIQDGKFLMCNLKKIKFDMNDFLQTARVAGYFDISNIKYAIMEANGKISFLPKEEYLPVVNGDMNLKVNQQGLCANVIIDGNVMEDNLKVIDKDKKWLLKQLSILGYQKINDILLAIVDVNGKLTIFKKYVNDKVKVVLE